MTNPESRAEYRMQMAVDLTRERDQLRAELAEAKVENERLRSCDCAASEDGNPHHQSYCRSLPTAQKRERHALLAQSYAGLVAQAREGNDLARQLADAHDETASARAEVEDWQEKWSIVDEDRREAQAERDRLAAQVAAMRALHGREVERIDADGEGQIVEQETCRHCSNLDGMGFAVAWPCATIRALDGTEQDGESR